METGFDERTNAQLLGGDSYTRVFKAGPTAFPAVRSETDTHTT